MKKLSAALLLLLGLASAALAQQVTNPAPAGIAGAFNTVLPTVTSGQFGFAQIDSAGRLIVSPGSAGSPNLIDCSAVNNILCGLIGGPIPTGTNTIGNVIIVDSAGVNKGTVKAASTAPAATDTSVVVGINPNSINTNGQATKANSAPVVVASDQLGPQAIASAFPTIPSSQYPGNAVAAANPITGNATGTTGAVVGTLAAAASKTTFICGFAISATGGVATLGPITVAGLIGSSMVFQLFSTASGVNLSQQFNPCIPASAANTAITITTTADGTATAVDVNSWGYQL